MSLSDKIINHKDGCCQDCGDWMADAELSAQYNDKIEKEEEER